MYRVAFDEKVLAEMVRRLVEALDPDRIVLFGSRARGDQQPDSDVDLLIVKASNGSTDQWDVRAYEALTGLGIPTDILCYTTQEVEDWAPVRNHVISRALREGQVLYERRH